MTEDVKNEIRQLSRIQRRVVGVLMEKAFTTPEQYPLTLKATTTGCNQKNNRDPLSDYSEDQVADALEELRQLGVVAEVFTDGGRAARYRHYMRHKFDFTETQFAVIAELLLRGRQQPGELRTRASRMVRIESQDQLKADLISLQEKGFIQANGPLERRGVEVDHTFYLPREGQVMQPAAAETEEKSAVSGSSSVPVTSGQSGPAAAAPSRPLVSDSSGTPAASAAVLKAIDERIAEVQAENARLRSSIESLEERLNRMERELGI